MDIVDVKEKWTNTINAVTIGATAAEGGTRGKTITVGGETTLPQLTFEGAIPNPPAIAGIVVDVVPGFETVDNLLVHPLTILVSLSYPTLRVFVPRSFGDPLLFEECSNTRMIADNKLHFVGIPIVYPSLIFEVSWPLDPLRFSL